MNSVNPATLKHSTAFFLIVISGLMANFSQAEEGSVTTQLSALVADEVELAKNQQAVAEVLLPQLLNNPFVLPASILASRLKTGSSLKVVSAEDLDLRAILFSAKNPLVNLNGEIISVGEKIQGYRLDRVYESYVELSKQEKFYRLDLVSEDPA